MKLYEDLCYYDPRNPDYDPENGTKPDKCYCDACFRGNNRLAEIAINLHEACETALFRLNRLLDEGGPDNSISQDIKIIEEALRKATE
jgi:hypothetical protein